MQEWSSEKSNSYNQQRRNSDGDTFGSQSQDFSPVTGYPRSSLKQMISERKSFTEVSITKKPSFHLKEINQTAEGSKQNSDRILDAQYQTGRSVSTINPQLPEAKSNNKKSLSKKNSQLPMVDEAQELPPDPKLKKFGRAPAPPVYARFEYLKEPTQLLQELTEFIYKHAKMMDFSNEPPNFWNTIISAVLSTQSYEHQIFKANLDNLIEENIKETGFDPRIGGPPEHIAAQVVAGLQKQIEEEIRKKKPPLPHSLQNTFSIMMKKSNRKSSEMARLAKMKQDQKVQKVFALTQNRLEKLNVIQESLHKLTNLNKKVNIKTLKTSLSMNNIDLEKFTHINQTECSTAQATMRLTPLMIQSRSQQNFNLVTNRDSIVSKELSPQPKIFQFRRDSVISKDLSPQQKLIQIRRDSVVSKDLSPQQKFIQLRRDSVVSKDLSPEARLFNQTAEFKSQKLAKPSPDLKYHTLRPIDSKLQTFQQPDIKVKTVCNVRSNSAQMTTKTNVQQIKLKKKKKRSIFFETMSQIKPKPREMLFLKTDNYALSEKQIKVIKKQRCTPLGGSTLSAKNGISEKTIAERRIQRSKDDFILKLQQRAIRKKIDESVKTSISQINQLLNFQLPTLPTSDGSDLDA